MLYPIELLARASVSIVAGSPPTGSREEGTALELFQGSGVSAGGVKSIVVDGPLCCG